MRFSTLVGCISLASTTFTALVKAKEWTEVSAAGAPLKRYDHAAVMDAQQRMWVFAGRSGRDRDSQSSNDLHYFDVQAKTWRTVWGKFPPKRYGHTAVLAQQQIWVFGGISGYLGEYFNDLHYFDIQANIWEEITDSGNGPSKRNGHSAVMDAQRMWIFGGTFLGDGGVYFYLDDLHCFDVEAKTWETVSASNAPPKRKEHTAVLDQQQRMWIFGGWHNSHLNDLHYFNVQARTWKKVTASNPPSKRSQHTAVLDQQQRMWIFGGWGDSGYLNDLQYFDVQAETWTFCWAPNAPSVRFGHSAALDAQQRMWIFGGVDLNDLHYIDLEVGSNQSESSQTNALTTSTTSSSSGSTTTTTAITTCKNFACPQGYIHNNISPQISGSTSACCELSCQIFECPPGYIQESKSPHLYGNPSECCEKSCKLFSCPQGYISTNTSPEIVGSSDACCEESCEVFSCPQGYISTNTSPEIVGSSDACCEKSCKLFSCPQGYISNTSPEIVGSSDACCEESCKLFSCPQGYVATNASPEIAGSSDACCEKSCKLFSCPQGYVATNASPEIAGSSDACCEESCELFLCPQGYLSRDSPQDVVGRTYQACCTLPKVVAASLFQEGSTGFGDKPLSLSQIEMHQSNLASNNSWTEGASSDDDDSPLLAIVVVPIVLTCLFTSLCILWRYRVYRARKRRGAEAEPHFSNPWVSLPAPVTTAKPLLFAWDARMTAEWPRGKVLKLTVRETAFDAHGRKHEFQPAECRQFAWEDGTVQKVDNVSRNVVLWSTQHRYPAWQQFRWICTPQCQIEGRHDMELADSNPYRCRSCSHSRAADMHWHCPLHEVHLCPSCAELPPEAPTLGVGATYLVEVFPPLAWSAAAKEDPNFYEICPHLAHGPQGMGYDRKCPRDGKQHCSIVDAVEDVYSGKVTHFVSWCWAYSLSNVVSAVEGWLQKSDEDPETIFLWMCFFCNNQYRIMEEATKTGSEDLKSIFESHLVTAGRMLVLLDSIEFASSRRSLWPFFFPGLQRTSSGTPCAREVLGSTFSFKL